ncbi:hypothetical protein C1H57_15150 [Clostridium sp. 2-1]|uniref:hypothetical protein n=1 Tax=Clostridium TaxID=1485 RepID=UPI000CDA4379|nr:MULTISPECIES: hypothetical protein [Clostridium]MBN7576343.1 hypothetical protein [Clostridium beijerinckii]MBN7580197.1 hypothetical protein [Clostridium beijerinckii]MBN7586100.1 hypothetical protein [Clostridium beijerinckii]MBO0522148.1 hypothetical protein [Clostridium beijerinckii]POO90476.1 hypothetical protein C1H57_15150 [Clostridium sp. 2-1]
MSNLLYDFLVSSELFNDNYIEEEYSKLSDKDLIKILTDYREYVLNCKELKEELINQDSKLSIQMESFNKFLPNEELLKQLAFYMDKIIINDPIFQMTNLKNEQSKVMNNYLGLKEQKVIDRKALVEKINYMKKLTPMVVGRYVKFRPMSYFHEPPKEIPICYSDNYFSDTLPKNVLEWFKKYVKVHNLEQDGDSLICKFNEKLKLGRRIMIEFEGHADSMSNMYFLFETKILEYNEKTGRAKMAYRLPDTLPSEEEFNAWVNQSINRTAGGFYNSVFKEVYNASLIGSSYFTTSSFIAELLNRDIGNVNSFEQDIFNLALNLNLPIINKADINNIMNIRENDGEAFLNFRIELRKRLKELRGIKDKTELKYKLENIEQEMNEVQVHEVDNKFKQLKRNIGSDLIIGAASLATTIQSGGLSLLGAAGAIAKGYKDYSDYVSKAKDNPGYFLWKIQRGNK